MNIKLLYSELQSLVKSKTGRDIALSAIDERTVRVEAKVKVKVPLLGEIEKHIGVNVSVEQIEGNDIRLNYSGGLGTDMIIGGLLTYVTSTPDVNMVEKTSGNGVVVHLAEIDDMKRMQKMLKN
ncbi:MAG: hypothetical protein ACI4CA_07360 [Bacteroides sp.]